MIIKIIPDDKNVRSEYLDEASLSVPALAIATAEKVLYLNLYDQLNICRNALENGVLVSDKKLKEFDQLMSELDHYLEEIVMPESISDRHRLTSLLRIVVYARVLRSDLEDLHHVIAIRTQPKIFQVALDYVHILENSLEDIFIHQNKSQISNFHEELLNLKLWTDEYRKDTRDKIIEYVSIHKLSAARNLELLASQRWLDRLIAHTQRLANVIDEKPADLSVLKEVI